LDYRVNVKNARSEVPPVLPDSPGFRVEPGFVTVTGIVTGVISGAGTSISGTVTTILPESREIGFSLTVPKFTQESELKLLPRTVRLNAPAPADLV
jgi:hypothetical protein